MAHYHRLSVVLFAWSYFCFGSCDLLKDHFAGLKNNADLGDFDRTGDTHDISEAENELLLRDTVSEHMVMLYDKYKGTGFHFKDGNTVRSFKAKWGTIRDKQLQIFNLTSLTKSEDILSATLHYYIGDLLNTSRKCARPMSCGHHGHRKQAHIHLAIWSLASVANNTRTLGHFHINASTVYRNFLSWQWKDITRVLNEAKHKDELLIGIEIASQGTRPWKKLLSKCSPYILVYANDSAISESEAVVSTLQRQGGSLAPGLHKLGVHTRNSTAERRSKRSANILFPLQNNELPGAEYQFNEAQAWGERNPYKALETRPAERQRNKKKQRKSDRHKVQTLQFDEQTLKKARRKQWNEPRNCARRYLKVDFADIGWSEWIISPKSFDAYYCSGSCQFPMPKSLKPSNHATIQSIVRAVGVVPGIPEPCCVPERMSSLTILFFDENKNVVLKVYPNMTVESCACR
ncbi:bone morphogenetic protein 3-like [Acipenser ruthenus]|uniref:bone morphogenetic protein 3-like n=1 Tax=Acipenser ruthenus TaxID=7906 RepID=UPI0027426014|nr:bone morphogenetic protein 3-like [Acipenser ruthenus]